MRDWIVRFARSFSVTALLIGTLSFAASLTPSLIPRGYLLQGVLSGCAFAAGYGLGVLIRILWDLLELPHAGPRTVIFLRIGASVVCLAVAIGFLVQASTWQNTIRALMEMEPVTRGRPIEIAIIAVSIFTGIVFIARGFKAVFNRLSLWLALFIPQRTAAILGGLLALFLTWSVVDGVLLRFSLRAADVSFQQIDALVEDNVRQPRENWRTGSDASLLDWQDLGRAGRQFVAFGPTRDAVERVAGDAQADPLRVFVGLNSADSPASRAALALEELKRTGAFDREVLVIATPIGTGAIDAPAISTLEYLHRGDVATVAVQYSYLTSWLSLLIEPAYGADTARAVFRLVYEHWTRLPRDERPKLYLHGLSLGALNSDRSVDLFDVIADPIDGAVWSGPPFASDTWQQATRERNPGSPAWLPRFRDGSVLRFTNQSNALAWPDGRWGPMRLVFLQYASDPVTFFDPRALYRRPDWMEGETAPDVSPDLQWFPIVTFLQLALDMATAVETPVGYGHRYAPEHYIDAWLAVSEPVGWSDADIERLKQHFIARRN